ncbi:fructose-bisphosphate aldolase class II [Halanaerobium congolense]|uniref:Fructose-bisphosphate aldolase class II n=1 Tax=Halanaerobium congolense TaxID=54121 RepID=A0A4R8GCR1_9FIRM|nr:class II fructose-bisphosphate aldolase [Halanaerobium congolense]TDX41808.1 fructose-bisphosphate aldolase class II [Halanaerobium congolense]
MLTNLNEVLPQARKEGYAVPAFDCIEDFMVRTILDTAEKNNSPVILMSLRHDLEGKGFSYIAGLINKVAPKYHIPIVLHLDHAEDFEFIKKAIDNGFSSVMYDGSKLPFEENIKNTKEVVDYAHAKGVTVEAELGHVGGMNLDGSKEGDSQLTKSEDVKTFIEKTGVDALAVSIGTAHGVYESEPKLNIERLKEINEVSSVPLVLHGGSGTPVKQVQKSIKNGITKINIFADLRISMYKGLLKAAEKAKKDARIDPTPDMLFEPIKNYLSNTVATKIEELFSDNRV